jgi:hypothetical protein
VLLIKAANGIDVDVALAAYPFEEQIIARATKFTYAKGVRLTTASAEDVVLMKCIADRPRDWQDVKDIASVQGESFDWPYVDRQLQGLAEIIELDAIQARLQPLRPNATTGNRRRKK